MLSGDNGILQKATTAKENAERAEIVENAKIDVLNEITGNKGNDLQESQLKSVLENYFIKSEIPEELPSDLSKLELTTLNNKYKIKVSEIYDGTLAKAKISKKLTEIVKNTDYGKPIDYSVTVNGTTLNNWKVFLNDGNNVYVILADDIDGSLLPDLGWPIQLNGNVYIFAYESYEDPENLVEKLLDTENFKDFSKGIGGISATGAPTKFQLEASSGIENLKEGSKLNEYMLRYCCIAEVDTESYGLYALVAGEIIGVDPEAMSGAAVHPLVKLTSEATGSVGASVSIDK